MRVSNIKFFVLSTLFMLLFVCKSSFALPDNPAEPLDNTVPVDGGAGILIAAGVAYGLKKIHDKRKEKKTDI